jgi:DedD protein
MDRRVKERLVGASILVVLIVLIAPELLSGPPGPAPASVGPRLPVSAPEPVRNVTVDLATSKATEPEPPEAEADASSAQPPEARSAEAASAVAGADASTNTGNTGTGPNAAPSSDTQPSADAHPTPDTRPSDTPPSAPPPRPASPRSLETAAPAPISPSAKPAMAGKAWAVQLGSFASRANADKLVRQLKAQGFSVYVVSGGSGPSLRYRVRIGPMADRGTATQAVAKLKSLGQVASLVPPAP